MTLPIRAFLIVRVGLDDWNVNVCRDLDAVIAAWQRRSDDSQSAILHLGFDRPSSPAFDQIATDFPGRMLFTAAAKYGVPSQFEASETPIGFVDDLPVFLALRGWGYTETSIPVAASPRSTTTAQGDWADWLVGFTQARPEFTHDLVKAQIFSEADYLSREAGLPWEARCRAGLYRFGHLIAGDGDDPCAVVRAGPPWFQSRSLEDIDLTVRLRNVFDRAGFAILADVGSVTLDELYKMSNFGRKSETHLQNVLLDTMAQGPRGGEVNVSANLGESENSPVLTSLLAELHRTLALCETRERDILVRRMGLGCEAETLQGLADKYNITRERIRQIESKATKRIVRKENWDDVLAEKMERLLANRDYPLPVLGLEAVDPWFAGIPEEDKAFGYLLANFCDDRVSIAKIGGVQYIGFITQEEWQNALNEGAKILKYAGDKNWTEKDVQALLIPALSEKAREFRVLLWEELSRRCHFSTNKNGERILVSFGRGMDNAVEAVLADAEAPLHYSEIARRLEERLGRQIDVRRAHSVAANVGILLGRGTFGSEKHLEIEPDDLERLSDEASSIILNGPISRQWHSAELLGGLIECGFASEHLNKYVVDYALRKSSVLNRLGRMAWSAKDGGSIGERIDIRDAVQALVFAAGRPLTTTEIRQRLVALRGVNDTFQFSFADPLIRVGPGLWGLNDRDVPIAREDQPTLIEHLILKLRQKSRGIHISEVSEELDRPFSEIAPQIVLSIGILDERLKVSVGQFLYLAEWIEPRRETIFQVVQRLVDKSLGVFTSADIIRQIERESTLPIDTSQVSACIRSAGATFDSILRVWSADRQPEDDLFESLN